MAVPVLCLLPTLLLGGCSSVNSQTPAGALEPKGPEVGAARVTALDEQRLRTALLDATDFPTGWAADTEKAAKERGRGIPQPEEAACRKLFASPGQPRAEVTAGFLRSRFGPFVSTSDAAHRSQSAARSALDTFQKSVGDCPRFRSTEDDQTTVYVAKPLDLPTLGDGSKAARYQEQGGEGLVDVVLAQVGSNTVLVAQAGRKDMAVGSVKPLVKRAVKKLQQVARGSTPAPESAQPGATEL